MKRWFAITASTLLLAVTLAGCLAQEPAGPITEPTARTTARSTAVTAPTVAMTTTAAATQSTTRKTAAPTKKPTQKAPATTAPQAIIVDRTVTKPAAKPTAPALAEQKPLNAALTPVAAKDYYGRQQLAAAGKPALVTAYDLLAAGIARFQEEVSVAGLGLTQEEVQKVFFYCLDDYPQLFWCKTFYYEYMPNGEVLSLRPQYTMTPAEAATDQAKVEAAAAALLKGLDSSLSEYDRELAIHDRLIRSTVYDEKAANAHSLVGALADGRAVCEGYARAFQYLLYQAGIPCLFVRGTATNETGTQRHAWNVVKLGGVWYQVDATWDDPTIKGLDDANYSSYAYFNITTEQIERDHVIVYEMAQKDKQDTSYQASYPIPACTKADGNNYFLRNGQVLGHFSEADIAAILAKSLNRGDDYIHIRLYASTTPQAFMQEFGKQQEHIWQLTADQLETPRTPSSFSFIPQASQNIVTIRFVWQE